MPASSKFQIDGTGSIRTDPDGRRPDEDTGSRQSEHSRSRARLRPPVLGAGSRRSGFWPWAARCYTEEARLSACSEADGVWKYYGDFPALRDIEFRVEAGSTLALLGRNGAGKTTLLRILAGLSKPSRGIVSRFTAQMRRETTRRRIGVLGHGSRSTTNFPPSRICCCSAASTAWPTRASGPRDGWSAPGSNASATAWSANFPAACASAWRWRAPSCTIPKCCCSTSLSPRSTTARSRCCNRCFEEVHAARPHHRHVHASASRSSGTGDARRTDPARPDRVRGERTQEMLDDTGWLYGPTGKTEVVSGSSRQALHHRREGPALRAAHQGSLNASLAFSLVILVLFSFAFDPSRRSTFRSFRAACCGWSFPSPERWC